MSVPIYLFASSAPANEIVNTQSFANITFMYVLQLYKYESCYKNNLQNDI